MEADESHPVRGDDAADRRDDGDGSAAERGGPRLTWFGIPVIEDPNMAPGEFGFRAADGSIWQVSVHNLLDHHPTTGPDAPNASAK